MFEPILIFDEDDTPKNKSLPLKEFLEIIEEHKNNSSFSVDDIYVTLSTHEYEDESGGDFLMAELTFSVEKNE